MKLEIDLEKKTAFELVNDIGQPFQRQTNITYYTVSGFEIFRGTDVR